MAPPTLPRPLRGIIPPMITPLVDQDQLDAPGAERLIEHLILGGVHGIFVLGTTGEATSLHPRVRHQFVELVCETVAGRLPVVVGITDTSASAAVELAEQSYAAGAAAVVAAPPYYLPMSQDDLRLYIEWLADRVPLPLLLYNMPSCTQTAFAVETVRDLRQHGNIIGLKDSSGDLEYFAEIVRITRGDPEFTLLIGPEENLARSIELGGHGGVSGGANMFPRLYVSLYEAATRGQTDRVHDLQRVIQQISASVYHVSNSGARVIQGIKTALSELGICSGVIAQPFRNYHDHERAMISAAIAEIEPRLERLCPPPQTARNLIQPRQR